MKKLLEIGNKLAGEMMDKVGKATQQVKEKAGAIKDTIVEVVEKEVKDVRASFENANEVKEKTLSISHEEIEQMAYYFWQMDGCPDGRHEHHWFQAKLHLERRNSDRKQTVEAKTADGYPLKEGDEVWIRSNTMASDEEPKKAVVYKINDGKIHYKEPVDGCYGAKLTSVFHMRKNAYWSAIPLSDATKSVSAH